MYTYQAVLRGKNKARKCEQCGKPFELVQRMSDDALTACPKCGRAIERVIMAPNLNGAGRYQKPTEKQLSQSGFTQYKRKGKGYYEKSFGSGPSSLHP
jgi:putative FmdB family regulatory protein